MKNTFLYIIVFICGGVVLSLEILGTRIMGPFYGVSIFLWSALISVTLTALTAGYFIGGRVADKKNNLRTLAVIILIPGIYILLIPFFRDAVIGLSESFGLRTAVLVSTFILFFPPLTFLGMVSPFAIKLRTETLNLVGTRAGDLYAVSTAGSVIAALLTGFLLIPWIGVIKLTVILGIILIVLASWIFFTSKKGIAAAMLLIISAAVSIVIVFFTGIEAGSEVVELRDSEYAEIRIMQKDEGRFLLIDGGIHTAIDKNTDENIMQYVWVIDILKNITGYSGDMLLIGLGGASVYKSFINDNWDVDAVEIDPVVTQMAVKYFYPQLNPAGIYHMDGREFLKNSKKTYDLIIMDAFGSSSVPFHLTTVEFFKLAKSRLNDEGFIAVNIEADGWDDKIVSSFYAVLKEIFKKAEVLPIVEPPDQLGNLILIASDNQIELKNELPRDYTDPDYRFSPAYERVHAWDNRFQPEISDAVLMTDDMNPVELWSERINFKARKKLHEMLGEISFTW